MASHEHEVAALKRQIVVLQAALSSARGVDIERTPELGDAEWETAPLVPEKLLSAAPSASHKRSVSAAVAPHDVEACPVTPEGHGKLKPRTSSKTYAEAGCAVIATQRLGWLLFFLSSLSVTSLVMGGFEDMLERKIDLAHFAPMLIGHGGNVGGQVISAILGELGGGRIGLRDTRRVLCKEVLAGTVNGALGSVVMIPLALVMHCTLTIMGILILSFVVITIFSSLLAAAVPFALLYAGLRPDTIAAPLITTLVDAIGLVIYLSIASAVFSMPHIP